MTDSSALACPSQNQCQILQCRLRAGGALGSPHRIEGRLDLDMMLQDQCQPVIVAGGGAGAGRGPQGAPDRFSVGVMAATTLSRILM